MGVTINRQRVAYQGRAFYVVTENITLPNGRTAEMDVLKHPGASAVVAMSDPETLVLVRQYRHALQSHIWEIPAGTLDPEESPLDCAKRELTEETGFSAENWEKLGEIVPVPGYSDERIHLYLASGLKTGVQNLDAGEWLEVHQISVSDVMKMIRNGDIQDAKSISGLLMVHQVLGWKRKT